MENKKIVIFGATGGTGRELVRQGLERGHSVTAFVRDPDKLGISHENLEIFTGDVFEYDSVKPAVSGQDAVISALGAPASVKEKVRSEGTKNIIRAMKETGVSRFICMTTIGMGESKVHLPLLFKYFLVPFILKDAFADSAVQEKYIVESDLDWTIVRPGSLTDKPATGGYRHGFSREEKVKAKVSRADVAAFMLDQIGDGSYLRKKPAISY